jgi:hypothetical protein
MSVLQGTQKNLLGSGITRGPVTADGHTQDSRGASLSLGLMHRMKDTASDPVQITAGL